jgi:hypothetical protein
VESLWPFVEVLAFEVSDQQPMKIQLPVRLEFAAFVDYFWMVTYDLFGLLPKYVSLFKLADSSCPIFLYAYIDNTEFTLSSNP